MLWTGNMRWGSFPTGHDSQLYDSCQCDGQFSESKQCRPSNIAFLNVPFDIRNSGLCGDVLNMNFSHPFVFNYVPTEKNWFDLDLLCTSGDQRPQFIWLQFGHGGTPHDLIWKQSLEPMMKRIKRYYEECKFPTKINYVVGGPNVQSRSLDRLYPQQGRENAATNINYIKALLKSSKEHKA